MTFTFIDLFAGIGGTRMALESVDNMVLNSGQEIQVKFESNRSALETLELDTSEVIKLKRMN